jgi:hypothetical protein
MKAAIMQPYFFPYIGYFQLIHSVDLFVCCDNMQYTKKGWINRNRWLQNHQEAFFTIPLENSPLKSNIIEKNIAPTFEPKKMLRQLEYNYKKSSCFLENFEIIQKAVLFEERNLFRFLENSIHQICRYLGITTKFGRTSEIPIDHTKRKEDKVVDMCQSLCASTYINSSGGKDLYSKDFFKSKGISLGFLDPIPLVYTQFEKPFIPWLSIIDVLMFNSLETTKKLLNHYEIS